ncbi:unnamed protein product [Linum trigynum]|uniref:CCHC-type domain-containing protein n=1 Tax=Linum trigynum TaxID=586398 RepID=A0AAV2GMI4_9ROSI
MAKRLNMLWARNDTIQITNRTNGYYFIRFTNKLEYEATLTGGPWLIGDHYITTQKWKKSFNPKTCKIASTLAWIHLPDLPIELFNPKAVMRIAARAGTPVRVYRAKKLGARGVYARACIEVDLTKPLLSKYKVEGVEYEINYEGLDNVCFECGMYGHSKNACPTLHSNEHTQETTLGGNPTDQVKHTEAYGEWMIAKRRERRPNRRADQGVVGNPTGKKASRDGNFAPGSRFSVLECEEVDNDIVPTKDTEMEVRVAAKEKGKGAERGKTSKPKVSPQKSQAIWVEKIPSQQNPQEEKRHIEGEESTSSENRHQPYDQVVAVGKTKGLSQNKETVKSIKNKQGLAKDGQIAKHISLSSSTQGMEGRNQAPNNSNTGGAKEGKGQYQDASMHPYNAIPGGQPSRVESVAPPRGCLRLTSNETKVTLRILRYDGFEHILMEL